MDLGVDLEASMPPGSKQEPVATPTSLQSHAANSRPSTGVPVVFKNNGSKEVPAVKRQDLSYTVKSAQSNKESVRILSGVTGCFSPGQMSALMGASGSGKTTLLDAISGRKTLGKLEGEIRYAGAAPSRPFLRRHTGYVEQADTLIGVLTVREMLLYTAEMKRPVGEPLAEKRRVVDQCIDVLGLEGCKDTRIGNSLNRGISGGQAKRVNVGLALVVDPQVLFLDEPTSGLDSYTSKEVMLAVRDVAARGVTVCATIHAPSQFCFSLFDRLLVLASGQVAYHGPNGDEMLDFLLQSCGVAPPESVLARHATAEAGGIRNAAEFLTDLVVGAQREGRSGEYLAAYGASAMRARMHAVADESSQVDSEDAAALVAGGGGGAAVTPWWKGVATLVRYRTVRNHCDPEFLLQRFSDKIIFSILMATLYRGVGSDLVETNYINVAAVLFMWTAMPAFTASSFIPELFLERPLYVRERADGLYLPITYLIAKIIDELAALLLSSVLFSALVFYVIELQGSFLVFWFTYLVTLATGLMLGYLVAVLSPTMDFANAALPAYVASLLFFTGFVLRFENMPGYWRWFSYLNFMRYCWGAHMINVFKDVKAGDGTVPQISGQPVLEYFDLAGESMWGYIGYESLFGAVFFVATWAALQFRSFAKR